MNFVRKASGTVSTFSDVPDGEAELLASTANPDRMNDVVEQGPGAFKYAAWMRLGGTILRDHDNRQPVANTVRASATSAGFTIRIRFPDWGVSDIADRTRREVKAGLLTGVSIGFRPLDYELRDARKPFSGIRFKEIEILEVSLVAVPANSDSMVIAKALYQRRTPYVPAPEREPLPIDYCGTYAERRWQANFDNVALRRRRALVLRLKAGLL